MTRLAKILIYVNLVLSLTVAAFALGVYTNRVDWVGVPPNQSEGVIKKREAEIKTLQDLYANVTARWAREYVALPALEKQRRENQEWYAQQLKALVDGQGNQPINVLLFKGGALQEDPQGRPQFTPAPDRDWVPVNVLDQRLAAIDQEIAATAKATQGLIKEEEALSLVLNGRNRNPRGLRDLLAETEAAMKSAEAELQHVKELRINGREATGSLLNRQRELKARLELLQKSGVAAAQKP